MPELRRDPFSRNWVILAPERARRPHPGDAPADGPQCPFCPGHESSTPEELWRLADEAGDWKVRVVRNRYPVLVPGPEPTAAPAAPTAEPDGPQDPGPGEPAGRRLFRAAAGTGSHEVVIESRSHGWDIPDGDDDAVADVLRACRDRTRALRARRHPGLVVPFRNHGPAAGTSMPHPHSQIIALPLVPPSRRRLLETARDHFERHGSSLYADVLDAELADGRRLVAVGGHAVALVPYAGRGPYETWILPRRPAASFADADDRELAETASLLRRTVTAVLSVLGPVSYNYVLANAPDGEEGVPWYSWQLTLVPRTAAGAGFELGTEMSITPVPPEDAAARLRAALPPRSPGDGGRGGPGGPGGPGRG
ncbi:galactose-1-phosphate uridylyltransferase [Streptomyces sp. YIM 98790]|uniref:galactose-1-phosphate uridylyltransferase n=1 Tax=Streptomyces sp. YIM 98790 TaxID=2689077 RepID=UPI001409AF48|nr:galactose-1-phosphate uridylyltransferase [Streptomyces sp. YIM 98790]